MRRGHVSVGRRSSQGAAANYKYPAGEPVDHALGRSRGGLTTKIHTLTDEQAAPVAMILTPGQAGDNPQLVPLLDARARAERGRFRLLADKAYSHPSARQRLRERKTPAPSPNALIRSAAARRKALPADVHRRLTRSSTATATPSNADTPA